MSNIITNKTESLILSCRVKNSAKTNKERCYSDDRFYAQKREVINITMIHSIKQKTSRISFYALCFLGCFIVQSVKAADIFSFKALGQQFIASEMTPIKPIEQLEREMANGNLESQVSLGIVLGFGYGVTAQPERAYKLIKQASDAGSADAHYTMAIFKQHGVGTSKDTNAAQQYLDKAFQQKSVTLLFVIAQNDSLSKTYQLSNEDRFIHIKNAAVKDNSFAKYYIGCVYHFGLLGVKANTSLAKSYYQEAAEAGLNEASYRLAFLLLQDKHPAKQAKGRKLIHQLVALDHKHAKLLLTFAQFTGKFGFEKKPDIALKNLTQLTQQADLIAIKRLYSIYKYGWYGIDKNEQKAYTILDDAINNKNIVDAELYFLMSLQYALKETPKQYLHYLTLAAQHGHARANYTLGIIYQDKSVSDYVQNDAAKGFAYLKSAYQLDPKDDDTQYALARNYHLGIGTKENTARAISLYEKAAKQKNKLAISTLLYMFNRESTKNIKKYNAYLKLAEKTMSVYELSEALIYSHNFRDLTPQVCAAHHIAADGGSVFSYRDSGRCYLQGIGSKKNGKKALARFTAMTTFDPNQMTDPEFKRITQKLKTHPKRLGFPNGDEISALGNFWIASTYQQGTPDVPINADQALAFYQKAVDTDYSPAMTSLAYMYHDGELVPKNHKKYIQLMEKAAKLDDFFAIISLAWAYRDGKLVAQDYAKAMSYWQRLLKHPDAVDDDKAMAYENIATQYHKAQGVEQDYKQAAQYYAKAIKYDSDSSRVELAQFYSFGLGVDKNVQKAIALLQHAKDKKYLWAYDALAAIYETHEDIEQDIRKSEQLYKEALTLDLSDDQRKWIEDGLSDLYEAYPDLKPTYLDTYHKIKEQANAGDSKSIIQLAALYERGLIVKKDWNKTVELLNQLAALDHADATYELSRFYR